MSGRVYRRGNCLYVLTVETSDLNVEILTVLKAQR